MLSPILRGLAAALLLATLVATDALPVSQPRCVMACCRVQGAMRHGGAMKHGDACQLRRAAVPHCAVGRSNGLPASFQSQQEKADRLGVRHFPTGEMVLASAGRVAEARSTAPPPPLFEPPVPPPRSLRFA
ncbi:MAG TPA: hypothetical protein VIA62_25285 [Thermoanaerobaculia bacterium]|jgi:hypothetical protein|nr:hypothetical protein [Thermoanaerobaculia bacterium]